MKRDDNYAVRRSHLAEMDDEALKDYFWELADRMVEPLAQLGYDHTTPSIERSVLLRMGFSSLEAKPIVETAVALGLLGHGAGNLVYRLAVSRQEDYRVVGRLLASGQLWNEVAELFLGGEKP